MCVSRVRGKKKMTPAVKLLFAARQQHLRWKSSLCTMRWQHGIGGEREGGLQDNIQTVKKFSDISLMLKSKEVKRVAGHGTCEGTVNISLV